MTPPSLRRHALLIPCLAALAGCIRVSVSRGDDSPWAPPGPEYTRGDTVERFAPGIVSTGSEFASAFTRDGRTVFFTRTNQDRSRLTLMRSRLANGAWSAPEQVPLGPITRAMDPHVAPDGRRLFFTAPRRQEAGAITEPGGDWDTWVAELAEDGATGAYRRLDGPFNTERVEMYTSVTRSGALYYGTAPLPGSADTTWRGVWRADLAPGGTTRRLEGAVNMPGFEGGNPYVTPDERVLIFGSARPGGSGRGDLWMSVRGDDGRWGDAVNLGPAVNGPEVEFCPQLSPDGRFLFFSRIHYRGEERVGNDVYVIKVSSVPALAAVLAAAPRR
jgi:Tol biopolymer transport system component